MMAGPAIVAATIQSELVPIWYTRPGPPTNAKPLIVLEKTANAVMKTPRLLPAMKKSCVDLVLRIAHHPTPMQIADRRPPTGASQSRDPSAPFLRVQELTQACLGLGRDVRVVEGDDERDDVDPRKSQTPYIIQAVGAGSPPKISSGPPSRNSR